MAFDTEISDDDTGYGTDVTPQTVENADSTPAETAAEGNTDEANTDDNRDSDVADNTEADGTDEEGGEDSEGAEPEQKPSRARDRIKQLVDERKALEAKLAKYEATHEPADNGGNSGYTDTGGPDITQYDISNDDGINEYLKACDDYAIDKAVNEKIAVRDQERHAAETTQKLTDEYTRAFERNPQFKENMSDLVTWMDDKPVTADPSLVLQGDDLMDVIAEIAADSDLYYRLADMTETQQYAEYGKIHTRLNGSSSAQDNAKVNTQGDKRVKSNAPKPPNHTKSNAPTKRNPYAVSDDDFLASRGY